MPGEAPTPRRRPLGPAARYGVVAAALLVLQHVVHAVTDGRWIYPLHDLRGYLSGLVQFDGHRYLQVAVDGYSYQPGEQSTIAWFPLYPLAIRALDTITSPELAAVLVTFVAGALAARLLERWLRDVAGLDAAGASTAWWALILYPYAFYLYGIVYADALFVALALATFLLAEKDHRWAAAATAALATATRPTGIAVALGLLVLQLTRDGVLVTGHGRWPTVARDRVRAVTFAPLLGFAGLASYMTYLGVRFGAPFAFVENQSTFRDGATPILNLSAVSALAESWRRADSTTILVGAGVAAVAVAVAILLRRRLSGPRALVAAIVVVGFVAAASRWRQFVEYPLYRTTTAAQALICLFVISSLPAVWRRFGPGYAVYCGVLVAMPVLSSGDLMGSGRYLIAAFPVAALWGERLAPRPWRIGWLVASGALMTAMWMGFTYSKYLA